MNNRDLQAGVERMYQKEYDERFGGESVSDCCESSWSEDGDNEGKWATCDSCKKECSVIEM